VTLAPVSFFIPKELFSSSPLIPGKAFFSFHLLTFVVRMRALARPGFPSFFFSLQPSSPSLACDVPFPPLSHSPIFRRYSPLSLSMKLKLLPLLLDPPFRSPPEYSRVGFYGPSFVITSIPVKFSPTSVCWSFFFAP